MRACVCIKCLNFAHHEVLATSRNPPKRLFIYPLNKVTKDKTTYSTPEDDSPKMASEPVEARGCVTERYEQFSHKSQGKECGDGVRFPEKELGIDYSDPWLYEDHGDIPLFEEKDSYTPEEVLDIILKDVRKIYAEEDMSAKGIEALKQKEELTVEEMQALLLNMVDEEYSRP